MTSNSTYTDISTIPSPTSVPSYLGPVGALLACCLGGLTGFGDAIALHILWAIAGILGLVSTSRRDVLAKAVTITAIMSLANTPLGLYFARKDLSRMIPYAVVTACTGIPMVIVGIQLLFFADFSSLKIFVGLFFLMFALGKLTSSVLSIAREKLQSYLAHTKVITPSTATAVSSATETTDRVVPKEVSESVETTNNSRTEPSVSTVMHEDTTPSTVTATDNYSQQGWMPSSATDSDLNVVSISSSSYPSSSPSTSSVSPPSLVSSHYPSWLNTLLSHIEPSSPKYTVPTTFLCCFIAGSGAGLLNGLLGTGGPPQMIAYSILEFNKDTIRAMSSLYGALELPLRCYFMFAGEGNVFRKEDYLEYIGVAVASWTGFTIGTALRKYVNTPSIIRILLMLVFASSSILLGALDHSGVAITYIIGGTVWLSILWILWYRYYWTSVQQGIAVWDNGWLKAKTIVSQIFRRNK